MVGRRELTSASWSLTSDTCPRQVHTNTDRQTDTLKQNVVIVFFFLSESGFQVGAEF